MPRPPVSEHELVRIRAAVDDERDRAMAFLRELAADPDLQAELERWRAVRTELHGFARGALLQLLADRNLPRDLEPWICELASVGSVEDVEAAARWAVERLLFTGLCPSSRTYWRVESPARLARRDADARLPRSTFELHTAAFMLVGGGWTQRQAINLLRFQWNKLARPARDPLQREIVTKGRPGRKRGASDAACADALLAFEDALRRRDIWVPGDGPPYKSRTYEDALNRWRETQADPPPVLARTMLQRGRPELQRRGIALEFLAPR